MKDKNKVAVVMLTALIVIMLVLLGVVIYWRARVLQQTNQDTQEDTQYIYHYVLISDKGNSTFWDHVYEGACAYGEENDAYIERMGDELAVNYSKEELMEIAIYAGVDGILLEGDESSVQKEMIDKAVEAGIPVVTMLNDNYGSLRQTFVGVGNYNLGREYAREVIRIATPDTKRVLILGDKIYEGQAQTGIGALAHLGTHDLMATHATTAVEGELNFKFKHVNSVAQLRLTVPAAATFTSVSVRCDEQIFAKVGNLDLSGAEYAWSIHEATNQLSMTLAEVATNQANGEVICYMMLPPVDMSGKTVYVILHSSDNKVYQGQLVSRKLDSGKAYSFQATLVDVTVSTDVAAPNFGSSNI